MRLTTKTRYGIRALYDLAFHCRGRSTQAKEIALRQSIPLRFLEQIFQGLRKAGIVEAKRGRRGGYALARSADAIKLAEIIAVLQGPIEELLAIDEGAPGNGRSTRRAKRRGRVLAQASPTARPAGAGIAPGGRAAVDVPALVWGEIATQIAAAVNAVTLQDLVARAEKLGLKRAVTEPTMYFI